MRALASRAPAYLAVGSASGQFATTMTEGAKYVVISTTACWAAFGADPTAQARTAANHYIPPNVPIEVVASMPSMKVALIRDSADGHASLSEVTS